jgi:hypothetical protein
MADDLAQLNISYFELNLKKAIDTNDRADIAKCLRELADNLAPELVKKLADYLDPAIEKPRYKEGPKPKKKRSWMFGHQVIGYYLFLCEDRELARYALNSDKEAFFLVENSELWDAEGNFSPKWQYPHRKRDRDLVKLPKKEAIKDLVCEMYKIGSRTFDDLRAEYNK